MSKDKLLLVELLELLLYCYCCSLDASAAGLLTINITESPLRKSFEIYLSLLIAVPLVFPFPPLLVSVHISLTSSNRLNQIKKKTNAKG